MATKRELLLAKRGRAQLQVLRGLSVAARHKLIWMVGDGSSALDIRSDVAGRERSPECNHVVQRFRFRGPRFRVGACAQHRVAPREKAILEIVERPSVADQRR